MNKQDKRPRDENGKRHGYWKQYYSNGQLFCKGSYIHGKAHGLWEEYHYNGELDYKVYYIK